MNLVADEGVDRPIVDRLREEGHQVLYIAELESGIGDDEVLALATSAAAVLLTTDLDFGEFAYRQRRLHTGQIRPDHHREPALFSALIVGLRNPNAHSQRFPAALSRQPGQLGSGSVVGR